MRFPLLLPPVLALALTACQNDGSSELITTPTGYTYEVIERGSGTEAAAGNFAYLHITLASQSDSIIGSTREGDQAMAFPIPPDSLQDRNIISPVEDVIRYARGGDSINIHFTPAPDQPRPRGFEADSIFYYRIKVTDIVDQTEYNRRQDELQAEADAVKAEVMARAPEVTAFAEQTLQAYKNGELELTTTASGLKYIIHEEGTGPETETGKGVLIQYLGKTVADGNIFDQSFQRGEAIPFVLGSGRVIPGWEEGIGYFREGTRATLFIPAELGYGAQGSATGDIPPGSELMFYVEVEEVQR